MGFLGFFNNTDYASCGGISVNSKRVVQSTLILSGVLLIVAITITSYASGSQNANSNVPPPDYKVAFIGDTDWEVEFEAVLALIKAEETDLVLHQGDFDYSKNPNGFFGKIDAALGADFPYLGSVGNHDVTNWPSNCGMTNGCYANHFTARMAANNIMPDDPDLNDEKYAITYNGLRIVFVGQNGNADEFAQFINEQIPVDNQAWKICSWHRNQKEMQVGAKSSQMGWAVYENCLNLGAIIATAHEHSYSRTRTLLSTELQTVDPACPDADALCVEEGKTFAFVSGLGGSPGRMDAQSRCLPTTFPYGCNGEWANIYSTSQGSNFGALFITFHVDGDPYKARGYFKDIDGNVVDEFVVTTKGNSLPSTETPTPTSTATSTATPDPTMTATPPAPGPLDNLVHLPYIIWEE